MPNGEGVVGVIGTASAPATALSQGHERSGFIQSRRFWIPFVAITTMIVLIATAVGSFYTAQSSPLLDVVGLIGDVFGIVTGLLGIWFYFESERLNRTSGKLLESADFRLKEVHERLARLVDDITRTLIDDALLRPGSRAQPQSYTSVLRGPETGDNHELDELNSENAGLRSENASLQDRIVELESVLQDVRRLRGGLSAPAAGFEELAYLVTAGDSPEDYSEVHAQPSGTSEVVSEWPPGTFLVTITAWGNYLPAIGDPEAWIRVRGPDGREGYVRGSDARIADRVTVNRTRYSPGVTGLS